MAPPPRAPPVLMEEMIEEIILRIPPNDPASLLRSALVCKPWCHLISAQGFRRRFRLFNRTPPMLGFLCNIRTRSRFIPTSSFRPPHGDQRLWWTLDARHGRVLFHTMGRKPGNPRGHIFSIWDPITGERKVLPALGEYMDGNTGDTWGAVVLCACHGAYDGACDLLDRHRGPFLVVIISTYGQQINAYVYSLETGVGVESISQSQHLNPNDYFNRGKPKALVGNALYFAFGTGTKLLKYDLVTQESSIFDPPICFANKRVVVTNTKEGHLGFAIVRDLKLYMWSREADPQGDVGWTLRRVIELEKLLPIGALSTMEPYVVAYVDVIDVFFVLTNGGLYTVDIKSSEVTKIPKITWFTGRTGIFPYMSFYTPALEVPSTSAGPRPSA